MTCIDLLEEYNPSMRSDKIHQYTMNMEYKMVKKDKKKYVKTAQ